MIPYEAYIHQTSGEWGTTAVAENINSIETYHRWRHLPDRIDQQRNVIFLTSVLWMPRH